MKRAAVCIYALGNLAWFASGVHAQPPVASLTLGWGDSPFTIGACEQPQGSTGVLENHHPDGSWERIGPCPHQGRIHQVSWFDHEVVISYTDYAILQQSLDPCAWSLVPGDHSHCQVFHYLVFSSAILRTTVPIWVAVTSPVEGGGFESQSRTEWCFSFSGPDSLDIRFTGCPEDLDASGEIDFGDMSVLLMLWGCSWPQRPDFDGSEFIDGGDLALLLMSFGPCGW